MLLSLYSGLTSLSAPLLKGLLKKRLKKGKEDPNRWQEKMGLYQKKRPDGSLIWFHGASVGESLSIISLIYLIKDLHPDANILVTTGTRTSAQLMETKLPEGTFHQFAPLDHPQWVNKFLEYWKPDLALWVESELWPNLLQATQKRHIPAFLLNARMSQKSFKNWQYASGFCRKILSTFTEILAQTEEDADRLRKLSDRPVFKLDNLKYSAPRPDFNIDTVQQIAPFFQDHKSWIFASTHKGEEELGLYAHQILRSKYPDFQTMIIPRHPERGQEIRKLAKSYNLDAHQRSKGELPSPDGLYIADTLGELTNLLFLSPITVMGGSLTPHGGHNPFEPAQIGRALIVGPHMFNFKEMMHHLRQNDACIELKNANDLSEELEKLISNKERQGKLSQHAEHLCTSLSRSLSEYYLKLKPYLPAPIEASSVATMPPTTPTAEEKLDHEDTKILA